MTEVLDTPKKFLEKIEGIPNVLIGNGFGLSHPQLKEAFKWDIHQALCSSWDSMLPSKSTGCPESDLGEIRIDILKKILTYYVEALFEACNPKERKEFKNLNSLYASYKKVQENWSCDTLLKFLLDNKNVFTLNYDPLLYFEVLGRGFIDGFRGETFIKQSEFKNNLNSKISKIFYLHGSWFIQTNEKNELRKLSFGKDSTHTIDSLFKTYEQIPHLILEDRWRVKKTLLESSENPYLKFCYDQLKNIEGKLLIFGCSFNKDKHIIDAIKYNKNLEEIYITHINGEELEKLTEKTQGISFKPLKIGENIIWEKRDPSS